MPATTTGAPFSLNVPSAATDLADLFGLYLVPNMSTINTNAAHKGAAQSFTALQTFSAGFNAATSGAKTVTTTSNTVTAIETSTTSSIVKTGLSVSSTGTWTGASAVNRGLYVTATGGTANYAAIFDQGFVGVGTTAPTVALDVTGAIKASTGLTISSGGVTVTGNSTITGTLGGLTGLTVASGGASITGNSTISGTLGSLTGLTLSSGIITVPLGSATAPSIVPSGGTNTGQWFPSTASIAWSSSGSEIMRMTATGLGIAQTSPGSALDVKGTLRLSGSTSGYVGFAPAAAAGSTTYTLPSADGAAGQSLQTNGAGTLSWGAASGGGGARAFALMGA